jgi:3-hydroxyisobutyrate dehydrogenase-like beta-hydroxyacid dehydrogenase
MNVGWIGLGGIGSQMAARALGAGHAVTAYARGAGQAAAADRGARLVRDYPAVAEGCDMLGVCVFSDAQVREAVIDSGALAALRPGAVLAIHTTGSPALARELGALAPAGVEVLDACFSGGPKETSEGDLTVMAGGAAEALERVRPVIATYARRIHHLGPLGSGQTLKLLNNLLFATNLKHAAEIMEIARAQGLDPTAAAQVIQASSGASMSMGLFVNRPPELILQGVRPYMVKDVQAAEAAASDAGVDLSSFAPILDYFR